MLAAVLSAVALCFNPRGPALLWFARVYANPNAVRLRYISEWQRPTFTSTDRWLFVGAAIVVGLTVLAMLWRRRLWPAVLSLTFAVAALRAIRYVPLFAVVAVPASGWVAGGFLGRIRRQRTEVSTRLQPLLGVTLMLAAFVAVPVGAWVHGSSQFRRVPDARWGGYPVDAADWVTDHVPEPRLFNEYGWGGYLIERFYPRRVVYIDGREEMYGERFFAHFVDTISAAPGWQQTLAAAGVNATVLDPSGPLATALNGDPGWRRAYSDETAAVFVPADSVAAKPSEWDSSSPTARR